MTCGVKRCRGLPSVTYLGYELCWKHWRRLCEKDPQPADAIEWLKKNAYKARSAT